MISDDNEKKKKKQQITSNAQGICFSDIEKSLQENLRQSFSKNLAELTDIASRNLVFSSMITGVQMSVRNSASSNVGAANSEPRRGMVLPFEPLSLAFNHVNYYVDMPAVSLSFSLSTTLHLTRMLNIH